MGFVVCVFVIGVVSGCTDAVAFRIVVKLLDSNARTILKAKTIRHQ